MNTLPEIDSLLSLFQSDLSVDARPDEALDGLLTATQSRAVGLWQVDGDVLVQLGFRAVDDMPAVVREEFAAGTLRVPLAETGLGIVKAVLTRAPAVAKLNPSETGLNASASWLARFGAVQSLAVPIRQDGATLGVLAVSTARTLAAGQREWTLMCDLAAALGDVLLQRD